jgi:hypothetical protein
MLSSFVIPFVVSWRDAEDAESRARDVTSTRSMFRPFFAVSSRRALQEDYTIAQRAIPVHRTILPLVTPRRDNVRSWHSETKGFNRFESAIEVRLDVGPPAAQGRV